MPAAALALGVLTTGANAQATAEAPGDVAAFLLGLRSAGVLAGSDERIRLNEVWGFAEALRLGPGRYRAEHKGGVLKLEASASMPESCVHKVEFVFRTAGLIDNKEVWTLDLRAAEMAVERKMTGVIKGVVFRVHGKNAFCYTSSLRADSCVESQLFDDHTPWAAEPDLERKIKELEDLVTRLRQQGCGR